MLGMIEAKDFRSVRVWNLRRNIVLPLAEEAAWKAFDTMTLDQRVSAELLR